MLCAVYDTTEQAQLHSGISNAGVLLLDKADKLRFPIAKTLLQPINMFSTRKNSHRTRVILMDEYTTNDYDSTLCLQMMNQNNMEEI